MKNREQWIHSTESERLSIIFMGYTTRESAPYAFFMMQCNDAKRLRDLLGRLYDDLQPKQPEKKP
jgi:hypothetical protein